MGLAAGWYDIGDGIERRHDGEQWTDERRPRAGEAAGDDRRAEGGGESAETAKKGGPGCLFGCLGLIAIPLVFFIVALATGSNNDNGDDSLSGRQASAEYACEQYVTDNLKSPSTADFTGTTASGAGPFTVTGEVDSQNGFGATVRSSFSCTVRITDDTASTTLNYLR